jgi:hypothetical protein
MKGNHTHSENQRIWITAHAFTRTFLSIEREHGFRVTGLKTWDFIKWNALGSPMISRLAIEKFFTERLPGGSSLQKASTVQQFTSGQEKRGRCFVAEHVYPTKALQDLVFNLYENADPSLEELCSLFKKYNRICYIWYEEDKCLTDNQLRSAVPQAALDSSYVESGDPLARYRANGIDIDPLETAFKDGHAIFPWLNKCRDRGDEIDTAIANLMQPS